MPTNRADQFNDFIIFCFISGHSYFIAHAAMSEFSIIELVVLVINLSLKYIVVAAQLIFLFWFFGIRGRWIDLTRRALLLLAFPQFVIHFLKCGSIIYSLVLKDTHLIGFLEQTFYHLVLQLIFKIFLIVSVLFLCSIFALHFLLRFNLILNLFKIFLVLLRSFWKHLLILVISNQVFEIFHAHLPRFLSFAFLYFIGFLWQLEWCLVLLRIFSIFIIRSLRGLRRYL